MTAPLSGKRVLFFAPKFFGYEIAISEKLREMGAEVVYYDERPKNNFWTKAFIRINRNLIKQTINNYYTSILEQTKTHRFDYVFVVNLEAMTTDVVNQLRAQQPQATFILYMWDSMKNKKSAQQSFPLFDWCYSFDKIDAATLPNVVFRPLFFIDQYDAHKWGEKVEQTYDLCFIGTVHSDRYNLVAEVKKQLNEQGRKGYFYMYFHNRILFFYKKFRDVKFIQARYREFSYTSISADAIIAKIKRSFGVLDIQHPYQTGLTMRTLEMVGAEKKLITTNQDIVTYDFYHPNNILLIDREQPKIHPDFWKTPYQPIQEDIRAYYSVEGWLKTIFKLA